MQKQTPAKGKEEVLRILSPGHFGDFSISWPVRRTAFLESPVSKMDVVNGGRRQYKLCPSPRSNASQTNSIWERPFLSLLGCPSPSWSAANPRDRPEQQQSAAAQHFRGISCSCNKAIQTQFQQTFAVHDPLGGIYSTARALPPPPQLFSSATASVWTA